MTEVIRRVSPEETSRLTEVGELTALAYLADGLVDVSGSYILQLRNAQSRAQHAHLLVLSDGERGEGSIVGTITVVPPGSPFIEFASGNEFELRMLAVNPIERGRGIGRKLTQAGIDLALSNGAPRVVLTTMESMHVAHRLYHGMGFQRQEDLDRYVIDNEDGTITRVTMAEAAMNPASVEGGVKLLGYSWEPH